MSQRVCPVWVGYLIAHPIRKLWQSPDKILAPFVRSGMTVLEVGPGMGFFTIAAAERVGKTGRVVAVDVQEGMLTVLRKRALREGLSERIETRVCTADSLGLADLVGAVDFILLFAVVHEVPNAEGLFGQLAQVAKVGCQILFAEPSGHVTEDAFSDSIGRASRAGFRLLKRIHIAGCHAATLVI